jgi:hypothetical protein
MAGGFLDGFTAWLLMFRRSVPVPGTRSTEVAAMLEEYYPAGPELDNAIAQLMEQSLELERKYTLSVRIIGSIQLVAILAAACVLALHHRF